MARRSGCYKYLFFRYVVDMMIGELYVITFVTAIKITMAWLKEHKRLTDLEKLQLETELLFLKTQISPHFFFNTLNNIYSLIEVNSNDAQNAVMKLSRLMRYLLYESEHGKTELSHEINFMNHYIDLMRLRISPKVELKIDLPNNETEYKIPPLLFIPFIENAFKHGISYREKSFIHISMQLDDCKILFNCVNSIGRQTEEATNNNHSGIGLENVKKRLNLLFPEKYKLKIKQSEIEFNVQLEIDLKES